MEGTALSAQHDSVGSAPTKHTARRVGLTVLVIAAGLIAVLATRPSTTASQVFSPLVSHQAPPIGGATSSGAPYSLPRAPGKYVVLNYFASWCEPCQVEGPELVKFQFEHQAAADATMVSVIFDDAFDKAKNYQSQLGVTWPTLSDPGGRVALSYGVREPPSTFVIAPDGRVVAYVIAPVTAAFLDKIIAAAKATHA